MYLDYNASAPLFPETKGAFIEALDIIGNASSIHYHGRALQRKIESTRYKLAKRLGISPLEHQLVFMSSATEANNMALKGHSGPVAAMATSHPSILHARDDLMMISVNSEGLVDLEELEKLLIENENLLISIIAAHNETGAIQPCEKIYVLCKKYKAWLHIDAVQAFGKINYNYENADLITLNGHKWGGPPGIGILTIRKSKSKHLPLFHGGSQEMKLRAGTENFPAIYSLEASLEHLDKYTISHQQSWHSNLLRQLKDIFPSSYCVAESVKRLPNTSCIIIPNLKSHTQLMHFDLSGISVSAGSACSSGSIKESPSLKAMGCSYADCSIRISTGWNTKKEEIAKLIECWQKLFNQIPNSSTTILSTQREAA